jgi:NAD(P)-dependent dehydrogenase (short-subunit alcohol dehydrogenase family)
MRDETTPGSGSSGASGARREGEETAREQRAIQDQVEQAEQEKEQEKKQEEGGQPKGSQEKGAVQAGPRDHPEPEFPEQHQEKPGSEKDLTPRPQYLAPAYKGSGKLQDMVAIVTGGDSGIGRAVCVLFAREGADVAIVYLSEHEDAEETKAAVEKEGRRALLIPGDVTDPQFCLGAVRRTVEEFGKLDVLVNNAAFQEHAKSLEEITEEHFDRTMKTNLYGYFHMAKATLPHLKEGSAIINTGSVTGLFGEKTLLDYSTTKGGIHAFTKSLAENLVEKGIRVNAVAPGPVWTPLNPADAPPEKVAKFGSSSSMKRPAQPEELSPAYVFLASPVCSSYITGEIVGVIGGVTSG